MALRTAGEYGLMIGLIVKYYTHGCEHSARSLRWVIQSWDGAKRSSGGKLDRIAHGKSIGKRAGGPSRLSDWLKKHGRSRSGIAHANRAEDPASPFRCSS